MTKLNITEKLGFLYITLAHFGLGLVLGVNLLLPLHIIVLPLSVILFGSIIVLDIFILREGLDVIFKKKEIKINIDDIKNPKEA